MSKSSRYGFLKNNETLIIPARIMSIKAGRLNFEQIFR